MRILEYKFPSQSKDFTFPLPVGCAILETRANGRQPIMVVLGDVKAKTETRYFSMRQTGAADVGEGKYIGSFDLSASAAAMTVWYVFETAAPKAEAPEAEIKA